MDSISKKIIRELQQRGSEKQSGNYTCSFSDQFARLCDTSIFELSSSIGVPVEDVRSAVNYLVDEDYLKYFTFRSGFGDLKNIGFQLSHKGKNLKEFNREKRRELLLKSVLLPIAVTLLTNGAISAIKWLFPQILQWLSNNS